MDDLHALLPGAAARRLRYAHASNAKLAPRRQAILHIALLAAAAATLPIAPAESWKPLGEEEPISAILLLLGAAVGLPYLLLSATSPLVQAWFARARPGANPYRLFSLSNVASLTALIGYPLAVEPFLSNGEQVAGWSWLFGLFALACAALAWRSATPVAANAAALPTRRRPNAPKCCTGWRCRPPARRCARGDQPRHAKRGAIPLLWLAPLTLYLSLILAFEGGFYRSEIFWGFCLVWLAVMAWLLVDADYQFELAPQLGVFLSGLFVTCLFCHGELYRLRPPPRHLTMFYLVVSAGGALGGLLVAVVAPLAFNGYYELWPLHDRGGLLAALRCATLHDTARNMSLAVLMGVTGAAVYDGLRFQEDVRLASRNFYGVLRVKEYGTPGEANHLRRLLHGVIMHGEQFLHPEHRGIATSYYQHSSGVGAALLARRERPGPMRVGVIGLGTGTLAAYGRKGDTYRFYDINPRVIELAGREFTYLADSDAKIELELGDARLSLEHEPPQEFDLLAVDAFSSDAIPVHLITREALALYLRHVQPDGIVAFHVSNRFLELVPVVARLAREHGAHAVAVYEGAAEDDSRTQSDWVLVSRDARALQGKEFEAVGAEPAEDREGLRTWTDDYSNLIQILK